MKITLQQMRYMLKIAETGSMVAASRVLSVSQPSLSEAVSVVERELGFSLFTRGNTGATPTKEGMEFLGRARQVVLQMDNLERRYGGNQPEGMRFAVIASLHVRGAGVFGRCAAGWFGQVRLGAQRDADAADHR